MRPNFKKSLFFIFSLFILSIVQNVKAQTLSGVVTSNQGENIPFASIYIKEITTGTTTNLDGEYSLVLSPGTYKISFQALGFARVIETISITNDDVIKNITLKHQDYQIKEVRVYSGKEDPAYGIMRKSISLAPYFLRQVKHYKANVYLKGGFDMNKVPRLFRKQLKEEGIVQGNTYLTESINEITFDSPNRFVHHQISKRSTIPNNSEDEVLGYLNYSFYDSDSDLAISPLSRKAFSFYKFRYEGFFQQGEYYINKIKVTPKKKNQQLFEGYIYIVDQLWNLHSVDLVNEQFFGKIRVRQVQEEVKGKAWLPVSHQFDVDVKTFGFNVIANYGGSVKYEEVNLDHELPVPSSLKNAYAEIFPEEKEQPAKETAKEDLNKNQQKIESLLQKEDLSNREMLKLSRLMEKENQSLEQKARGLKLESLDSTYKIIRDTIDADSIDWNKIRPIPLSKKEVQSFGIQDSLTLALAGVDKDSVEVKKEKSKRARIIGDILGGKKYTLKDSSGIITLRHYGLINLNSIGFNAVDGWQLLQRFNFRYYLPNKLQSRLNMYPEFKYAFGRKEFNWKLGSVFNYEHIKHTAFYFNAGQWSQDFNSETGISNFANTVSSLLLKENYMRLYQDNFAQFGVKTDLANGLVLDVNGKYQDVDKLENSTDYALAYPKRNYYKNNNIEGQTNPAIFNGRKSFYLESKLQYTPKYYYRIDGGKKKMIYSNYPTFTLKYKQGFDGVMNSSSKYQMMEFGVDQDLEWNFMYALNYKVKAGYYFENSLMHFSNYSHFNTSEIPVSLKDWKQNFNLLDDYRYSTNEWFVEAHLCYSTPYFLIKHLPFLQDKLWTENIYLHHLTQPNFRNYNEIGYGVSQIFLMMNVGVFAGFHEFEFKEVGFKVSLNLD